MKKFTFTTRVTAAALAVSALAFFNTTGASAASQTISLSVSQVTASNFYLNLDWGGVSGATHYKVRTANDPGISTSDLVWADVTSSSLHKQMSSSVGYRYFKIYAYDSAGTLLAYSNIVGAAKYPSGLVVKMKKDSALTNSYPYSTSANYQKPKWFITLNSTVKSSYCAANFQIGEFITESTITSGIVDPLMVQHVQAARNRYGVMPINSGFRTPSHNAAIGGATFSRHMYGDAVDIPASSSSAYNSLNNVFAPEYPSYVEPYSQGGYNHWHGDWRNENKGYTNY
ncbi:MAG TPA: D-Ala-D-Ala carboxypeptidase family metallohydrolase [Bacilli bacterium]|nr:D-Ala-D-Ala carboxypeptidase family metallohydrolase [Bacilli bacterium]